MNYISSRALPAATYAFEQRCMSDSTVDIFLFLGSVLTVCLACTKRESESVSERAVSSRIACGWYLIAMPRKTNKKAAPLLPAPARLPDLQSLINSKGQDTSGLQRYLDSGGSPNVSNKWGLDYPVPLLHMLVIVYLAGEIQHLTSIDMVLRAGAAIDVFSDSHTPGHPAMTALMQACKFNSCAKLPALLLGRGAAVCLQTSPGGETALHMAAESGADDNCRLLVSRDRRALAVKCLKGYTPLMAAVPPGHCRTVKLLHELGSDIAAVDPQGHSALHLAAAWDHLPLITYLLNCGVNVDVPTTEGCSPLFSAASHSSLAAMQLLIERGADMRLGCKVNGKTAMFIAAEAGQVRALQFLVSLGPDCDAVDFNGTSPLMSASVTGKVAAVEYLLSQGADINRLNIERCDALRHAATHSRCPELVELLLANGAAVDTLSINGTTALSAAAANGDAATAAVLLAAGSSAAHACHAGITCLQHAVYYSNAACVKLLLEHGAVAVIDNLAPCPCGHCSCPVTALMMCTEPAVLQQLLRAGADVHKTTAAGDSCLHIAAKHKYTAAVLCLFIKAGVNLAAVNRDGLTAAQVAHAAGNALAEALLIRAARD
jgi:ankyrin repeat domain-containing protein 17